MKLICCKCKKEIRKGRDRWVNIRDFNKGKNVGEKDLHLQCWKDLAKNSIQKAFSEATNKVVPMLKDMLGNTGMVQNA